MRFRMYVDEVGNSDLKSSTNPNERYLSLSGVIFEWDYIKGVHEKLESLKRKYFDSHPDDPIILHRKEIVNKKHPFESLRDPNCEKTFNTDLLALIAELDFTLITVVIDKLEHNNQYEKWRYDPYH